MTLNCRRVRVFDEFAEMSGAFCESCFCGEHQVFVGGQVVEPVLFVFVALLLDPPFQPCFVIGGEVFAGDSLEDSCP